MGNREKPWRQSMFCLGLGPWFYQRGFLDVRYFDCFGQPDATTTTMETFFFFLLLLVQEVQEERRKEGRRLRGEVASDPRPTRRKTLREREKKERRKRKENSF